MTNMTGVRGISGTPEPGPETLGPTLWLKPVIVLAVAIAAAAAILFAVPALFARLLESPAVAALSAATLESLFTVVTFGLLGGVAVVGMHLSGVSPGLASNNAAMGGAGFALGLVGLAVTLALSTLAGVAQVGASAIQPRLLIGFETVLLLLQSGVEELYFRGWLQAVLEDAWGRRAGLAVTALAFAGLHFVAAASEPLSFVTLLLGGLWFGLLYQRSGSLLLATGAHFGWNWAEELLFGLTPNPGTGNFGALFNVELVGSGWWGGTGEGLNASVGAIVVLVAAIAATLAWPWPGEGRRPQTGRPQTGRNQTGRPT